MQREVYVLPNGDSFLAWNIKLTALKQSRESAPCLIHGRDGSVRNGTVRFTIESADVSFCTFPHSLQVGQQGQLSSTDDKFFEITVSSFEPIEDHVIVFGNASRRFGYERDP